MFSDACHSDYTHLLAQYNTLMVKFGKVLHTVLVHNMVQMHYSVDFISFLVVRTTYGIQVLYHVLPPSQIIRHFGKLNSFPKCLII